MKEKLLNRVVRAAWSMSAAKPSEQGGMWLKEETQMMMMAVIKKAIDNEAKIAKSLQELKVNQGFNVHKAFYKLDRDGKGFLHTGDVKRLLKRVMGRDTRDEEVLVLANRWMGGGGEEKITHERFARQFGNLESATA